MGLPNPEDLLEDRVADGGVWRQSFSYSDLAHIIIPREFFWENFERGYEMVYKKQNIDLLSAKLLDAKIDHRLTDLLLEVKLY